MVHHRIQQLGYASRYLPLALKSMLGSMLGSPAHHWHGALPNVFIAGGKRCGTTQLKAMLATHPDIYVPTGFDETRFFERWHHPQQFRRLCDSASFGLTRLDEKTLGAIHYLLLYARGISIGNLRRYPIRLDKSVNYLFFPKCATMIRTLIPAARIIILLRNPTDRAISDYYFNCQKFWSYGGVGLPKERRDPTEALTREDAAIDAAWNRVMQGEAMTSHDYDLLRIFAYLKRGLYAEQARRYIDCFPAEQLLILRSEEMYIDMPAVAERVFQFIGLDPKRLQQPSAAQLAAGRNETKYANPKAEVYDYLNAYYAKPNQDLYDLLQGSPRWEK